MKLLTYSHILAGILSLVAAPIALAVAKGGKAHVILGNIFFWCMAWIFVSATILSVAHNNLFLLLIGVFSFYNVWIGYRALSHKQIHMGRGVTWYDWAALLIAGGFNAYFVGYGSLLAIEGRGSAFAYLSIMFGLIGLALVAQNARRFLRPTADKNQWLFQHIIGFMGGFIASVTAFSSQTMQFMPDFLVWAWPTLVGSPVIASFIRYYKSRLAQGARLTELVIIQK